MEGLRAFSQSRIIRKLKPQTRLRLLNALGICYSHVGNVEEAVALFQKARTLAQRHGESGWIGQTYINTGVAYARTADGQRAATWYRKALEHGRKTDDLTLAARSLGNLSQISMKDDPDEARELLAESIRLKRATKDEAGIARSFAQLGNLEVTIGNHEAAIQFFEKAKQHAERLGLRYEQATALHSLGNAHLDCGRRAKARSFFRRASRIADDDGFDSIRTIFLAYEGRVSFELQDYAAAEAAFQQLLALAESEDDVTNRICALHGIGVIQILQANPAEARKILSRALRLARTFRGNSARILVELDEKRQTAVNQCGECSQNV